MAKKKTLSIVATGKPIHLGDGSMVGAEPVDVDVEQAEQCIAMGIGELADGGTTVVAVDDASGPDVTESD